MSSGNPVPGASVTDERVRNRPGPDDHTASQQVRDIEEIIAKLEIVTKRLTDPVRADDGTGSADAIADWS